MEHILGNKELKNHFTTAIRQNKISHAYILEGERGSGKKRMAAAFAKLLMCEHPAGMPAESDMDLKELRDHNEFRDHKELQACGRCTSCIMMDHRDHPDVIWVRHEKPGVISVGEIREQLVNTVDVMPYRGPYKIYIVDEAEKMNQAAQNAVLKTIEEPPDYAVILLLTANRGAFLPTILSRCILLSMKPLPDETVKRYLMEECRVEEETAEFCAGFAMGNIGKAKEAAVSEEFAGLKVCGMSLLQYLHELTDKEIMNRIKELKGWQSRISDYLDIMVIWFRDILVVKALGSRGRLVFQNEYTYISRQSRLFSYEAIGEILAEIRQARLRLGANVNPDAALEMLHISIKNKCRNK